MLENVIAQAEVHFDKSLAGKTYISHQRVGYPFHITRPFYLDPIPAGLLTLYLQSVSGGIYRGEDLYENDGFIVHFFSKEKVNQLTKGFEVLDIEKFEEGTFPRKLFMVKNKKI